ncbi:MAG: DUF4197 domain-containing protein [Chitinophagaceae bacterium]|nr:DUF4197 domain-containing protein [Chitinophagaceae bacterium]
MIKKIYTLIAITLFFTSCDLLQGISIPLTEADVANGLKEALIQGVNRGGNSLFSTQANGNSALLNKLLPKDVASILNTAKSLGLSPKIDAFSKNLNTAAVNSTQKAMPIFINAIRAMNISDAWNTLHGEKNAATNFLRKATGTALVGAIQPEVKTVFQSIGLQPSLLANLGSKNPLLSALNIDMTALLTNMVTTKMYEKIEQEEAKVRTDAGARTTALMQRVFAAATPVVQGR